ncbi:MAG: hypothetical protein ACREKI_05290 [Gemmatimonadota bacterium]
MAITSDVKFFEGLEIPDEQGEDIAWRTAAQLFQIDVSAPTPS